MPKNYYGRPGLVHRIDKNTSGILLVAKTEDALTHLAKQFYEKTTERTYWALVWGELYPKSGIVDAPIGTARPNQSSIRIKQVVHGADSKTAKTKYHTLSTQWIESQNYSVLG